MFSFIRLWSPDTGTWENRHQHPEWTLKSWRNSARNQQTSAGTLSQIRCLTLVPDRCSDSYRSLSVPHRSASGLDTWAKWNIVSHRHSPCWQRFASLWKQPQHASPNAQSSPKCSCTLFTPCCAGPLYAFWEDGPEHCAQFSKQGDAIVLESGGMTSSVFSSFWHCFLFWNTVFWNAAFLENICCNVGSFSCCSSLISSLNKNRQLRTHHCIYKAQIFSFYYLTLHIIIFMSRFINPLVVFLSFYNYTQLVLFFTTLPYFLFNSKLFTPAYSTSFLECLRIC